MTRRERLADAAITTLARKGMRALTHRAVDRAAGVPEGSTSYYFPTRQALLQAAVERLAETDTADVASRPALSGRASLSELADEITGLVENWLTAGRDRMLARYELALEANRRPELQEALVAGGARVRGMTESMLFAAGARDPARQAPLLAAYIDGLIFDHLAGAGALTLTRPELSTAVEDLLHCLIQ